MFSTGKVLHILFCIYVLKIPTVVPEKAKNRSSLENKFTEESSTLIKYITEGPGKGLGYDWLANVTDTFGSRILGSVALESAIDFVVGNLRKQGFDNVHTETVENLPNWVRGAEIATLLQPRRHKMAILGLGGSVPTPDKGIVANVVVVRSFQELIIAGRAGKVRGRVLIYNEPWLGDYAKTAAYRSGASQAAKWGAVAMLVRSITPFSVYSPHTGLTEYSNPKLKIPAAAITVEDAEMLWRMQKRGEKLKMFLKIKSRTLETKISSRNTVFELRGTEKPQEILLLSGHFDSWDVGEGAMDDGGGCAVMWQALTCLKALAMKPKRTIRVVFWIGEEESYLGSSAYYKLHKTWQNETFIMVSESDEGVFKPTSLNASIQFYGSPDDLIKMREISGILQSNGIPVSVKVAFPGEMGDVEPWATGGTPAFIYENADKLDYYFIFHHTNGDTMTVFRPEDIDYTAAVFAVFANAIANVEQPWETVH